MLSACASPHPCFACCPRPRRPADTAMHAHTHAGGGDKDLQARCASKPLLLCRNLPEDATCANVACMCASFHQLHRAAGPHLNAHVCDCAGLRACGPCASAMASSGANCRRHVEAEAMRARTTPGSYWFRIHDSACMHVLAAYAGTCRSVPLSRDTGTG